jgi:colanic acid/amylovoran biosynthesis glycosyltransferase
MGVRTLPLATACNIPLITTFYGYDLSLLPEREPQWCDRYQTLFDQGTHFLVEGSHMRDQIIDLGCPEEKVTVHHLGVDTKTFPVEKRSRPNNEPLRVLVAGRFTEKKGFPDAIKAFGRFVRRGGDGELTIVGGLRNDAEDQAARRQIWSIVKDLGLTERVTLRGFLPHEQLLELYIRHHVFLSPSVHASDGDNEGGAPVTIIEASATGMPIVGTWHCDIPEVVKPNRTGLLAQEGDIDQLADHLDTLYRDQILLKEMGSAARERVGREYNAQTQGRRLDRLYQKIRAAYGSAQRAHTH